MSISVNLVLLVRKRVIIKQLNLVTNGLIREIVAVKSEVFIDVNFLVYCEKNLNVVAVMQALETTSRRMNCTNC